MKGKIIKKKQSRNIKVHLNAISRKLKSKKDAYIAGKKVARKWMISASYQEVLDVLPRSSSHNDMNYFAIMRNNLFTSIEQKFPKETKNFKWFNNIDFMKGWRHEVVLLWRSCKNKIIN